LNPENRGAAIGGFAGSHIVDGRVNGRSWYQVKLGHRHGHGYAPLLRPDHYRYRDY